MLPHQTSTTSTHIEYRLLRSYQLNKALDSIVLRWLTLFCRNESMCYWSPEVFRRGLFTYPIRLCMLIFDSLLPCDSSPNNVLISHSSYSPPCVILGSCVFFNTNAPHLILSCR